MDTNKKMDREALDVVVIRYAQESRAFDAEETRTSEETKERKDAERAREALLRGDLELARKMAHEVDPEACNEPRLRFQMQGQELIEMMRPGEEEDMERSLRFAKDVLGPSALDAYPEAYDEFKTRMLAFVTGPPKTSNEAESRGDGDPWSQSKRKHLADLLYVTLVQSKKAYEPTLVLMIKYLLLATDSYCRSKGIVNQAQWMFDLLKFRGKERLPSPFPCQGSSIPLNESDVQSLVQAAQISRQEAVQGLKCVGGNLELALKNELVRVEIDQSALDQLLFEHAVIRGLAVPPFPAHEDNVRWNEQSSSSGGHEKAPMIWYGHAGSRVARQDSLTAKQRQFLDVMGEIYMGRFDRAEEKLRENGGSMLGDDPSILFQLKQLKLFAYLKQGAADDALKVVRNELSPLALAYPELQRELEDAVLALTQQGTLSAEETFCKVLSDMQKALNIALEVEEPRLAQGIQFLLQCHVEWFRLQQCVDRLAKFVALETLSDAHLQLMSAPPQPLEIADPTPEYLRARYGRTRIDNQWMLDRRVNTNSENSILTLMEFMALSREDAIRLLRDHSGSVESALSSLIP